MRAGRPLRSARTRGRDQHHRCTAHQSYIASRKRHLHVDSDAIDQLRRDLVGRHRTAEEAHTHAGHEEAEARLARAKNDAERLAVVRSAVVVAANKLALEI
eukprot:77914-Prymnesium_polylepis.1